MTGHELFNNLTKPKTLTINYAKDMHVLSGLVGLGFAVFFSAQKNLIGFVRRFGYFIGHPIWVQSKNAARQKSTSTSGARSCA